MLVNSLWVREVILDYPDGPSVITGIFKQERGKQRSQSQRCEDAVLMSLYLEERGYKPENAHGLQKLEKAREWILKNLWKEREHLAF